MASTSNGNESAMGDTAHPNFKLGADTKSSIVKECRTTKKKIQTLVTVVKTQ